MSKLVASHQALADRGNAGSSATWLTSGQAALRGVQVGLLGGILLASYEAGSLVFRDSRGHRMLFGALVLATIVLGANLLACVVVNRLAPPGDEGRRLRRLVLSWLLEGALIPMYFLPPVLVLVIGPPVLRVLDALMQP
jgi:hypothetical protein